MKNMTDIAMILDRSGSMDRIRADTIGGFNTFLDDQRKLPDAAVLSVVQFDDVYEVVYAGRDIREAPRLTEATFVPRNSTALLDAIGRTISDTGARLRALPDADRPARVIMVVITDGMENASKEYTRARIFDMIKHQREKYSWEFVFIGANQDSIAVAADIGIHIAANFTADRPGVHKLYSDVSSSLGNYRSGGKYTP